MNSVNAVGFAALILAASPAAGQQRTDPTRSPASKRPPATRTAQTYTASQIQAGGTRFAAQCGFCHGRDAQGGESGPDLTHSALVAEDLRGDKIGPVILSGRPEKGMPAFGLPAVDVTAIVAFIHDAKSKAESQAGGRRSVEIADLQTGNAEAGKGYFNGSGKCITCHSLSGSFAKVGSRFQGLALLQRMLYPGSRGPRATEFVPLVTITTATGQKFTGKLAYRDEFTISLTDSDGWNRSWLITAVKIEGDDALRAHTDQLGIYTDEQIHDVFAYLQTLK